MPTEAFLLELAPLRDAFFKKPQGDLDQAETVLLQILAKQPSAFEKRPAGELLGLMYRSRKRYAQAYDIYLLIEDAYQAGYCAMLMEDMPKLQAQWGKVFSQHPNHWCLSLFSMVFGQLQNVPTLFQIRNNLESDIGALLAAGRMDWVQKMLAHISFLSQINLESAKFAGRALMHAGHYEEALPYLMQGQKLLPNDPEVYYHLAQVSAATGHEAEAQLMLRQCLLISSTYTPAKRLFDDINARLAKVSAS